MAANPQLNDGLCWICENETTVTWIGPIHTGTVSAPMFACERCCQRLHELVWKSLQARDQPR